MSVADDSNIQHRQFVSCASKVVAHGCLHALVAAVISYIAFDHLIMLHHDFLEHFVI
jgi:hypothetical protein